MTSVLVTHDIEQALEISDRVALLEHGKLRFVGTPAEFRASDGPRGEGLRRPPGGRRRRPQDHGGTVSTQKPLPPAPPSRGRNRELMVGLLVIAGIAAILIDPLHPHRRRPLPRPLHREHHRPQRGRHPQGRSRADARREHRADPAVLHQQGGRHDPPGDRGGVQDPVRLAGGAEERAGSWGAWSRTWSPALRPKTAGLGGQPARARSGRACSSRWTTSRRPAQAAVGRVEQLLSDETVTNVEKGSGEMRAAASRSCRPRWASSERSSSSSPATCGSRRRGWRRRPPAPSWSRRSSVSTPSRERMDGV